MTTPRVLTARDIERLIDAHLDAPSDVYRVIMDGLYAYASVVAAAKILHGAVAVSESNAAQMGIGREWGELGTALAAIPEES